MLSTDRLLAFAAVSLLIIAIPGPGVVFVVGRTLANGRRTAFASAAGHELGGFVLVAGVALGLGSALERSVLLFGTLKLLGAAYLVFLGVRAIVRRKALGGLGDAVPARPSGGRALLDGFLVGVTNPKGAVFFAAVLPQFVDRSAGGITGQMLVLGLVFVTIALLCDAGWTLIAGAARSWFGRSPRRTELIGAAGGFAMVGLGVSVALSGRKD